MLLWLMSLPLYVSRENYKDLGMMFSHLCVAILIGDSLNRTKCLWMCKGHGDESLLRWFQGTGSALLHMNKYLYRGSLR